MKHVGSTRVILGSTLVAVSIVAAKTVMPTIPIQTTVLASSIGLALIFLLFRSDARRRRENDAAMQPAAVAEVLDPDAIRRRLEQRPVPQVSTSLLARDMRAGVADADMWRPAEPWSQPVASNPLPPRAEPPVLELVPPAWQPEADFADADEPILELTETMEMAPHPVELDWDDFETYAHEPESVLDLADQPEISAEPAVAIEAETASPPADEEGEEEPGSTQSELPLIPAWLTSRAPPGPEDAPESDPWGPDMSDFAWEPWDSTDVNATPARVADDEWLATETAGEPAVDDSIELPAEDPTDVWSVEPAVEGPASEEPAIEEPSFEPEPVFDAEPAAEAEAIVEPESTAWPEEVAPEPVAATEPETQPVWTPAPAAYAYTGAGSPVDAARQHALVLREVFPPHAAPGLSFYGGTPVAPAGFAWPRAQTEGGEIPLTFIMQWDCGALAAHDDTGLLPRDGVLYLFMDLDWLRPMAYRFIHVAAPTDGFAPVAIPEDLPPAYGSQAVWAWPICAGTDHDVRGIIPRRLPQWAFEPCAVTLDEAAGPYWHAGHAIGAQLSRIDGPVALSQDAPFARPYAAFPHDWSAVRTVCAWLLDLMRSPDQPAEVMQWLDETRMLYAVASREEPFEAVPQVSADEMWGWMEMLRPTLEPVFADLASAAINATLGAQGPAASVIPGDWIARAGAAHRLATREAPNRMLGTPSFVQGHVGPFVESEVLLLELGGNDTLGHFFGTGVLQFTIAPDALARRDFGQVRMTVSAT